MYIRALSRVPVLALMLSLGACLCGCSRSVAWLDRRDRGDIVMQRAQARQNEGDIESAIRLYTEALEGNPGLSRAHLEVALLLHDRRKDYVRAIYHYSRYLETRPAAEKRDMILNRIRLAKQAFAASLIKAERYGMDRVLALESENEGLKRKVVTLKDEAARAETRLQATEQRLQAAEARIAEFRAAAARATAPPTNPHPLEREPVETEPRTYRVKRGDNLSAIAVKMYGDANQWRKIADANRDKLRGGDRVIVGQELVIPRP